jgi:hypothetical protein
MLAIIIITLSSFAIAKILKKFAKKVSPYLLFAIADVLIGLLILGFAIYDFNTAVGEFAGILGEMVLLIGEPIVVVLLIIDAIAWNMSRENIKNKLYHTKPINKE